MKMISVYILMQQASTINWGMWSVIVATIALVVTALTLIIRATRNHAKLEESHENHVKNTSEKIRGLHHRIDEKADKEVVQNIDKKLDMILDNMISKNSISKN